jgi:hypothetical protein
MCFETVRPINATSPKSRTVPTVSSRGPLYIHGRARASSPCTLSRCAITCSLDTHALHLRRAVRGPCLHRVLIAATGAASPRQVVLVVWGRVRVIVEGLDRGAAAARWPT